MPDRIVGEIPKSARESIRISLREKAGQLGADLRIAATTGRGPMRETAKGLRIPVSRIGDVIRALQEAERLASREGRRTLDHQPARIASTTS